MKFLKPLCKKCWLIRDGKIPCPSKDSPFCQTWDNSGKNKKPDTNYRESTRDMLDRVLVEAEEIHGYPVKIEVEKKKFGCFMEFLQHSAMLHEDFFHSNYNRLIRTLKHETKLEILKRNKTGYQEMQDLYQLKTAGAEGMLFNCNEQKEVKVIIILEEKKNGILNDNVYLFMAPNTHLSAFKITPFGADPMPSFAFGYYDNRYLNRREILVLLRKWSHSFRYFYTNLEFFNINKKKSIFRKDFGKLITPAINFLRKSKIFQENRGNKGFKETQIRYQRIREMAPTPGMTMHRLLKELHYKYEITQMKKILKGYPRAKGFWKLT